MKKLLCCALALLLCAAGALADVGSALKVVNCREYVTLREEPDTHAAALAKVPLGARVDEIRGAENGFSCVSYHGQTGYVLTEYLQCDENYFGTEIQPTREQRYNLNLFLSNFTETGFTWNGGCYDASWVDEAVLTEFAIDHCWFNQQDRIESGEYFNYNNMRLSEKRIAPIVEKYFGVKINPPHKLPYTDYKDGWYYWQETGGHTSDGFACQYRVDALGGGRYCVWFGIFARGEHWENEACNYDWDTAEKAWPPYGAAPVGRAVIDVGGSGLDDRSDWRLVRYAVAWD